MSPLKDEHAVRTVLERNGDRTLNFQPGLVTSTEAGTMLTRARLSDAVQELFRDNAEISLFISLGTNYIDGAGGFRDPGEEVAHHFGILGMVPRQARSGSRVFRVIRYEKRGDFVARELRAAPARKRH